MANEQWVQLLGAFLLGVLAALGICFAWYSRRLAGMAVRVHRANEARQLAAQQVTQARKQVEQLQRDCGELRLAIRHGGVRPAAVASAPAPFDAAPDAAEATRRYVEAKMRGPAPKDEPEAFPDTLVLRPHRP